MQSCTYDALLDAGGVGGHFNVGAAVRVDREWCRRVVPSRRREHRLRLVEEKLLEYQRAPATAREAQRVLARSELDLDRLGLVPPAEGVVGRYLHDGAGVNRQLQVLVRVPGGDVRGEVVRPLQPQAISVSEHHQDHQDLVGGALRVCSPRRSA